MTFERFYSIIRPLKAASFNTVKRARIIIACVFVSCFSYCIPFLFITGTNGRTCVPNRFASVSLLGELYHWLSQIVLFIFPFLSLLIMNSSIIHILRQRSKQKILGSSPEGQTESQRLKIKYSEKQIITMLLLVIFTFLILNIPTRTLVIYLTFYASNTPQYYAGLHLLKLESKPTTLTMPSTSFFMSCPDKSWGRI